MEQQNVAGSSRLQGSLGTSSIVFMVIAAAAPLTVIGGNAPIAIASGNGMGAPAGFLIASIVMLMFSISFMAMTPYVKEAGAFFSYVSLGLGKRLGTGTAFMALVAYTAIQAGIYGYMGWAVGDYVRNLGGPDIHWGVYSLITLVAIAFLGYRHIELSSKILGIALVSEIAIVLIMNAFILSSPADGQIALTSFTPDAVITQGLGIAILFALTGFIGFEATAVFRDEAVAPEKTVPRATYISVLTIGAFYTLSVWGLVLGNGEQGVVTAAQATLDGHANLLLDTAGQFGGPVIREIMQVLLITSIFACVLSFHNVLARYQFNLGRRGTLPTSMATVHPVHQSPSRSSLVQSVTAGVIVLLCAAIGLDPLTQVFGYMAGIATIGMVCMMLLTAAAALVFFRRHQQLAQGKVVQTKIAPVVAGVLLLSCLWLALSHFTMITGGSTEVSVLLALVAPFAFLVGLTLGRASPCESDALPVSR